LFTIDIPEPGSFVADVEIKNIDSNYKSIDFNIPQNESLGDWKPESVNLCGHIQKFDKDLTLQTVTNKTDLY
jgi:hypothetical protein